MQIWVLCVHGHVFMCSWSCVYVVSWLRASVGRVSVYLHLCPSLEPNLINHFYVTGLSLYPLKTPEDLSFLKDVFQKNTILSPLLPNTHTHTHTHTNTHTHTHTHSCTHTSTLKCLQSEESQLQRRTQFCENS